MKHLDAVDGVIGAIPIEERPSSGVISDNIELLILHLRMPDAETWIAHTATHAVIRLEEQQIQDYLLISNGLMHRTPCVFSLKEETVGCLDGLLLEQLSREGIGLTDSPGGGCGPPRGMSVRGGGGPVRVRGDVKLRYSAGELLKAPVPNEP